MTRCGWQSRDYSSVLAGRAPSRVPSGRQKAISALPLESIVLETDCPYMAPEPVRGTRCDSSLIRYVGEYIAQLRGISAEEVFRTTAEKCPPGIRAVIRFSQVAQVFLCASV